MKRGRKATKSRGQGAPVRIGVVGLGIGKMHLRHLTERDDASVVAVCDRDSRRLRAAQREFGVEARYQDLDAMLRAERPDGLIVATPNHLHEPMVLSGLAAGCHVMCEKPLAHTWESAQRIAAAAAKRRGRVTMIDLSFRFTAASRTVHAYLQSGEAGRLYHARTQWSRSRGIPFFGPWFHDRRRSGGGPLIDLGVHRLDLALWFLGEPKVKSVSAATHGLLGRRLAQRRRARYDVEDLAVGLMRLSGGGSLSLDCSWAENSSRKEVMCTRGPGRSRRRGTTQPRQRLRVRGKAVEGSQWALCGAFAEPVSTLRDHAIR